MAQVEALSQPAARRRRPWNRKDGVGAALSAAIPLLVVLLGNALIYWTGWNVGSPALDRVPYAPSGWVVGLIWCVVYPMWGLTRWQAWQAGLRGRWAALFVVILMGWGLCYPVVAGFTGLFWSSIANVFSLCLALVTFYQVLRASTRASLWMVPSILWLCFACYLGFAALARAG